MTETAWRSIDSAPKDGTSVLVFWYGEAMKVVRWDGGGWFDGSGWLQRVTHWQPLPDPPSKTE